MSDKVKLTAATSKTIKAKRPVSATNTRKVPSTTVKEKPTLSRPKIKKNSTIMFDGDATVLTDNSGSPLPEFSSENRQIAYGKFLRAMLEDCLVDEKIQREETQMDIQMAQLADRFQKTVDVLDKTNRRLKDISFVVEQKRLLDLKRQDSSKFYEMTEKSDIKNILQDLSRTEQCCLDRLETKNIDFGYNQESGHKQLLDTVNEAINELEDIKKHSNLDVNKFEEYAKSHELITEYEKDKFDAETLKAEFDVKFPKLNEKLLKEASEKMCRMIEEDDFSDD